MRFMKNYQTFLANKSQLSGDFGFKPTFMPDCLFDFQKSLVEWSVRKGRGAEFADCGLGKTLMQLAWAQNIVERENRPVIIMTPLAVAHQTVREAEKFGIEAVQSRDGKFKKSDRIIVTNYERLHYFNRHDFAAAVLDESSILKNFDGARKTEITAFMRKMPYRLLCTATAAPNDYVELGTSSEALGELGHIAMLQRFFKAVNGSFAQGGSRRTVFQGHVGNWYLKPHAEHDFWRWVCSWARAIRKPSDLGFDDANFELPQLVTREHTVEARTPNPEFLFDMPAVGLTEQREERKRTVNERCEMAELLLRDTDCAVAWCHLNSEGDTLTNLIDGAVQVSGSDPDEKKEEIFTAFEAGEVRVLVTKPTIAGYGLNWQHCHRQTFFPSHSFEQWYQAVRRSWRFGQTEQVTVDVISSEGQKGVLANLKRKQEAADRMFSELVRLMGDELKIIEEDKNNQPEEIPSWLSSTRKSPKNTRSTTAIAAK